MTLFATVGDDELDRLSVGYRTKNRPFDWAAGKSKADQESVLFIARSSSAAIHLASYNHEREERQDQEVPARDTHRYFQTG